MKSLFSTLLTAAVLLTTSVTGVSAQTGEVRYDATFKIDIELPPRMAHMEADIPSSRTSKRMLLFNESESITKNAPADEEAEEDDGETEVVTAGGRMRFRMMNSGNRSERLYYRSLESGQTIEQRDFLGRTFLITGEEETFPWRLTGEQGEYEGYLTQKAVATVDSTTIEAWFTPQIPVSLGPAEYGGLPGLILVLNVDGGERQYTATRIDLESTPDIERPTDGKKVTREEYDRIVEEKREEMRAQRGRGGDGFRVIINND